MIRFGPSGNSDEFYEQGFKSTWQQMEWISNMKLNAYEYSFGKGVHIKAETAGKIAGEADKYGIEISCHAPYYINFATDDPEKIERNIGYIIESCEAASHLRAQRIVVHPGALMKLERGAAQKLLISGFGLALERMDKLGYRQTLCPETMGKINQMGSLDEVIEICKAFPETLPAIDFGHLYARTLGGIRGREDYERIIDALFDNLGDRANNIHVHFSRIEYTKMGEKKHLTFDDGVFGPDYEPLMRIFAERKMEPVVICESKGTMAKDALAMKTAYEECLK